MRQKHRLSWPQARTAIVECGVLAVACLLTYRLITTLLSHVYSLSRADDLLGGLWAVIATVFVLRDSYARSMAAAVTRIAATLVGFALCLLYLAFLPFHPWALAVLVGASALALILMGRPGDAATAAITTAVVMVVAAISPQHAWQQPILRLADTIAGTAVALAAAWAGTHATKLLHAGQQTPPEAPQETAADTPHAPAQSVRLTPGPSDTEQAHEDHS